jgi:hypothetical protein
MLTNTVNVLPPPPPMPVGTPVRFIISWIAEGATDAYVSKIYAPEELVTAYSWNYYDIVTFKDGRRHKTIFGKHLVNLLTGLREDGSKMIISG